MPSRRDIESAARIAGDWRKNGPAATAAILYHLHMSEGMSHNQLHELTGIATSTIGRYINDHRREVTVSNG